MKKVLIVDDDEAIRNLVRHALKDEGYELSEAADGTAALARAREFAPDLVVLDLMMPDLWGFEVCDQIKKDPVTKKALVLFLSARGSLPSQKHGEHKGGDAYMVKPFKPSELREKIKQLLGKR